MNLLYRDEYERSVRCEGAGLDVEGNEYVRHFCRKGSKQEDVMMEKRGFKLEYRRFIFHAIEREVWSQAWIGI